jgi:hypothetical protein
MPQRFVCALHLMDRGSFQKLLGEDVAHVIHEAVQERARQGACLCRHKKNVSNKNLCPVLKFM